MKPVLITGATGFVGSAVARVLAARGLPLRCVIRTGTAERLPGGVEAEVIETPDLFGETSDWWKDRLSDADMAVHLAWYAEPGKYLTDPRNLDCLAGTLAMAKGAAAAGLRRFVGVGTCFEYDLSPGYLAPDGPLDPLTPYAAAKAAAWLALSRYLPSQGVSFLWARLFYLHGPGEDPRRLVAYLHRQLQAGEPALLSGGSQVRDFLPVEEGAALMVDEALGLREGATNIASGQGITVRDMALRIADHYGRRDLLRFGVRPDNLTDPPCVVGLRPEAVA